MGFFDSVGIITTRNGSGAVTGYREDLAIGDTISAALTSYTSVTSVQWNLIGRPAWSTAGGSGPEPIFLTTGPSCSFTVDSDSGGIRRDGTYVLQATINPGANNSANITAILVRVSGITLAIPGGTMNLRKMGGFEGLEDTSIPTIKQGYKTQADAWLEIVRQLFLGGSSSTTLAQAYAHGTIASDQTLTLADVNGGGLVVDGSHGGYTGQSALKIMTGGATVVVDRATGNLGVGTTSPTKELHLAGSGPAVRLDRTGGAALDIANVGDELQFLNGSTVLAKLEPTGGLRADLGLAINTAPATAPALAFGAGSSAPISASGTARFRYNDGTGHAEWSENGGPYQQFAAMSSLFYLTIENHGTALTQRPAWNASTGLTAVDNPGNTRTDVTVNLSTGVAGGQSAFGGTNSGDALTLQGTTNSTAGNVKVVVGTAAGQGLKLVRTDGVELVEMLPYLGGSSPPLGVKIDGILSTPEISVGTVVNNDSANNQLTLVSGFGGPVGSSGLVISAAFGTGDATGYQVLIEPGPSQLANALGVLNTTGSPTFAITAAGAATFAGPVTISNLVGPGFVKASSVGLLTVDTTAYTPTTRTVQGTSPILIAGGTAAVDLSANRVWSLAANGVTYGFLQTGAALSIPGRASNSAGQWADIATTSGSGAVLRESGGTIGWGTITAGAITGIFYQTMAAGGTALTQRSTLNFIAPILAADNPGAGRTDVSLTIDDTLAVVSGTLGRAALTGDVTASAGSNTLTIAANAVTNAKFRQSGANTLVGNATGATANVTDIGLVAPLFLSGGNLVLDYDGNSLVLSGGTVLLRAALTGDVTASAGLNNTTIAANAVTNAKFRQSAGLSVVGNSTSTTANVADITATASGQVLQDLGATIGWAALAYSSLTGAPTIFYQTMQSAGSALTQRLVLNFTADFSAVDNSGSARTDVSIATNAVTYAKMQKVSASTLLGNPTGSSANISEITLGSGLAFSGTTLTATGSGGTVTTVTGTAPIFITSIPTSTPNVTIQGAITSGDTTTSPQSLGALNNGTLQQTVASGVATVTAFNGTTASVPFYTTNGQLAQDNANFSYDSTAHTLTLGGSSALHLTATSATISAVNAISVTSGSTLILNATGAVVAASNSNVEFAIQTTGNAFFGVGQVYFGASNPQTQAAAAGPTVMDFALTPASTASAAVLGSMYQWENTTITLTGTTHVTGAQLGLAFFKSPTITDSSAVTVDSPFTVAIAGVPFAGGSVTFGTGFTAPKALWVQSGLTELDGAVAINGPAVGSNQSLVVGRSTEPLRDSAAFFLGAGSVLASNAGDYFHIFLGATSLNASSGTFGNLFSVTIDAIAYSSTGTLSFSGSNEATSLYVKGKPTYGSGFTVSPPAQYTAHFGDGVVRVDGDATFGYVNGPRVFQLPSNTNHSPAGGSPTMVVEVFITGVGEKFLYLYDH